MARQIVELKFHTIDDWNHPVFKAEVNGRTYLFGSTDILFEWNATEEAVKERVGLGNLVYFGTGIDDDPMGTPLDSFAVEFIIA